VLDFSFRKKHAQTLRDHRENASRLERRSPKEADFGGAARWPKTFSIIKEGKGLLARGKPPVFEETFGLPNRPHPLSGCKKNNGPPDREKTWFIIVEQGRFMSRGGGFQSGVD